MKQLKEAFDAFLWGTFATIGAGSVYIGFHVAVYAYYGLPFQL